MEGPELYLRLGQYGEAYEAYERLLTELKGFEPYDNPWLSESKLVRRLKEAAEDFVRANEYELAIRFRESLRSVIPEVDSATLVAQAYQKWAEYLESQSRAEPWLSAEATMSVAREKWRLAAVSYRDLARLRFATRHYTNDLWLSASAFLKGRNYRQAIASLRVYLESESRSRRARGLLGLGKAYLALGEPEKAIKPLDDMIKFYHNHPLSYRARIVASRVMILKENWDAAEKMLLTNLDHQDLSPSSVEWRDSLFALGALYYRRGMHADAESRVHGLQPAREDWRRESLQKLERAHQFFNAAARRLAEAVARYPDDRQATLARYQLAEAQRKGTRYLLKRRAAETIESDRVIWRRQIRNRLETAIDGYVKLQELLNVKQEAQQLSYTESMILRNSYFARADSLFDLEQYAEAIAAYSSVSNRYQNEPIALEAFVQMASCYHLMGQLDDARGTLEQAKVVLRRIPPDANFLATTRYRREEWSDLLDWMVSL